MDIKELRIKTLRQVMGALSQKDFSNRHGLDASYLSQLLNGHRSLGEKAALTLEEKIGLPPGTLVSPSTEQKKVPPEAGIDKKQLMEALGFVTIPHLNVSGSMGNGNTIDHHVEVIRDITVNFDWLKAQSLAFSSLDNLAIISGDGDSMEPTFRNGDSLLVDRGITSIKTDAIYVFTIDGELFIKRLQRMTKGSLLMISDNPVYKPILLEGADLEKVYIEARVLLAWNAKKL